MLLKQNVHYNVMLANGNGRRRLERKVTNSTSLAMTRSMFSIFRTGESLNLLSYTNLQLVSYILHDEV